MLFVDHYGMQRGGGKVDEQSLKGSIDVAGIGSPL